MIDDTVNNLRNAGLKIRIYGAAELVLGKQRARRSIVALYTRRMVRGGILFVHVPKAAGTSVAVELFGARVGHVSAIEIRDFIGHEKYSRMTSFTIVRNPFSRLVSAYRFARSGRAEHGQVRNPKRFRVHAFRCFDSFVDEWLCRQDLQHTDILFREQSSFVYQDDQLLVDYVGRVEALTEVAEFLSEKLKRNFNFKRYNVSSNTYDWRQYYSSHCTTEAVRELYKRDLASFGYPVSIDERKI